MLLSKGIGFFLGLSLFALGHGISGGCFNCLMTALFERGDNQRETAFFYSYSAMNIGFLIGFYLSGLYDLNSRYDILFDMTMLLTFLRILTFLCYWSCFQFAMIQERFIFRLKSQMYRCCFVFLILIFMVLGFYFSRMANLLCLSVGWLCFLHLGYLLRKQTNEDDRQNIRLFFYLTLSAFIFWMIYYTGPMGVALYINHNVNREWLGLKLATPWIFNVNALLIMFGAPLFARVMSRLRSKGQYCDVKTLFTLGLLCLSLSFFVLAIGIYRANEWGYAHIGYSILHFVFQSIGELFIAPIGYAMIGRLAPASLKGYMMGVWMMISGLAVCGSHYLSNMMQLTQQTSPLISNPQYIHTFSVFGLYTLVAALSLLLIQRLSEDIKGRQTAWVSTNGRFSV